MSPFIALIGYFLFTNFIGPYFFMIFTNNPYLINILSLVVGGLVISIFLLPRPLWRTFYKQPLYHFIAPVTLLLTLGFTGILWMMG